MILFSEVSKNIDQKIVIKNISFYIKNNEFVFIYDKGRNTLSLMRELMSGIKKPDSGLIRLLNISHPDSMTIKREIGIVFKDNILLPDRTLAENFKFIKEVKGIPSVYYKYRINKALNLVNLRSHFNSSPEKLLPHQLIRANIAQALLSNPSILILEDPTFSLDELNSQAIFHLLEEINKLGTTIVFLTTDNKLITRHGDKKRVNINEEEITC